MPMNNPTWAINQKTQPALAHKAKTEVSKDNDAHSMERSAAPLRASIFPALKKSDMPMMHIAILV